MRGRDRLSAISFAIIFFGLTSLISTSFATPAHSSLLAPTRTAKCTIDIANGTPAECTLIKANHEWILWSNSAPALRSVHFKSDDNPFTETGCWDVAPGARARSGPTALNVAAKTFVAYPSDVPCASNPPSNTNRSTVKVIIQ
jgi:hypothetical protein